MVGAMLSKKERRDVWFGDFSAFDNRFAAVRHGVLICGVYLHKRLGAASHREYESFDNF